MSNEKLAKEVLDELEDRSGLIIRAYDLGFKDGMKEGIGRGIGRIKGGSPRSDSEYYGMRSALMKLEEQ